MPTTNNLENSSFDTQHYSALKCLHNYDELGMNTSIKLARNTTIEKLKVLNLECTKNIYKKLLRLQMLQQLEDMSKFQFKRSELSGHSIIGKWILQDTIPHSDFSYKEPILCQRVSILKAFRISAIRNLNKIAPEPLNTTILKIIEESRKEDEINIAIRNRALLDTQEHNKWFEGKLILEDAQLQWAIGERSLARKLVKSIIDDSEYEASLNRVVALRLYGEFLAECEAENPVSIYQNYFIKANNLLDKFTSKKSSFLKVNSHVSSDDYDRFEINNKLKIYDAIAKYSDREYVQVE